MKTLLFFSAILINFFANNASVLANDFIQAKARFSEAELDAPAQSIEIEVVSEEIQFEPVKTDTLRLTGAGIKPRKSEQSLALACADTGCTTLRFVYFKSSLEAYFIGDSLRMPQTSNRQLQTKALRLVIQDFFDHHQNETSEANLRKHGFRSFLLIGAGMTFAVFTGGSTLLLGAAVGTGGLGAYLFLTSRGMIDLMVEGDMLDISITKTSGWNWRSTPKKVSKKTFNLVVNQILSGKDTLNWQDKSLRESQIYRKKSKLYQEGVQF